MNLKKMNKGLDFLRGKYGVKAGEIALRDGHCYVGKTPLLPGRMERKIVELKKMTENGTLDPSAEKSPSLRGFPKQPRVRWKSKGQNPESWPAGPALLLALCRPAGPGAPARMGKGRVRELHPGGRRGSMYSCHLFLISSASVRSIPFLSFIEPIFA